MRRTLNDVIDDIGIGWCHFRLIFFAGSIYAVGGEVLFLYATLPGAISKELGLTGYERAVLGSVVFLGMLVGNLLCCVIDSLGRRIPILAALFGILVFAGASAMVDSFLAIALLWILTGFAYGIGVPTWNALSSETSPTPWRFFLNGISMTIFPLGSLHAALCVLQYAPDLASIGQNWRTIILFERIPNLVFLALGLFPGFVESPHFLALVGRRDEAKAQLKTMAGQNGRPSTCLDFAADTVPTITNTSAPERIGILFGRHLWATTLVIGFTTFMLNFISFGSMYTLPVILSSVDLGMSPAMSLVTTQLFDLLGHVFGIGVERFTQHKTLMVIYLLGCLLFTAVFIHGVSTLEKDPFSQNGILLVLSGINGSRLFIAVGWIVTYVYAAAAFPTAVRATASGVCIGCGRLGSISAPWVFEHLLAATGSYLWYFWITGIACLLNIFLVLLALKETKGAPLEELVAISRTTGKN